MPRHLDFAEEQNPWSVVILEDGARLRIRMIVLQVLLQDEPAPDGSPQYGVKLQAIIEPVPKDQPIAKPVSSKPA